METTIWNLTFQWPCSSLVHQELCLSWSSDKPTLEALDHHGIMQADETGSSALQTPGGPMVPQRQENDRAMGRIVAEMRASTAVSTKAMARAEKEATRVRLRARRPQR